VDLVQTTLFLSLVAGYGDVDESGFPSANERDLHLWTNAARVDPGAFEGEYDLEPEPCTLDDFEPDERIPKAPIYFSRPLNEAARFHSDDMQENDWFAHESSDGTSFSDRVARWYSETTWVGENIAFGYVDGFDAVMHGWMCSPGHRANIMDGDWTELGTGTNFNGPNQWSRYYTQDFGGGTRDSSSAIAMGVHSPLSAGAGTATTFLADYQGPGPDSFRVVVNGLSYDLALTYGVETQGVWNTTLNLPDDRACHEYYFQAEDSERTSIFPETGSYQTGTDCDSDLFWIDRHMGITGEDDLSPEAVREDLDLVGGCSSLGETSPHPLFWWPGLLGLLIPRRKLPKTPF
jgi:hypothetical protein